MDAGLNATSSLRSRESKYRPSWVDQLQRFVELLPWPAWLTYVAAWVALTGTETALKWADGAYPVGSVFPHHLMAAGTPVYGLALIHYLDRHVQRALAVFRPVLTLDEQAIAEIRVQLTTMPRGPVLVASVLGVGLGLVQRFTIFAAHGDHLMYTSSGPIFYYELLAIAAATWVVVCVYTYHTIRQLRIIDGLYRTAAIFDLFHVRPLTAFSGFSARNALGVVMIGYAWAATYPPEMGTQVMTLVLGTLAALVVLAIIVSVWPLLGAHQRLAVERERRLQEIRHQLYAVVRELHARVDGANYAGMEGIEKAISSLMAELSFVEKASTWPWQTRTLRGFVTAVLLPLVLWTIQQTLIRIGIS